MRLNAAQTTWLQQQQPGLSAILPQPGTDQQLQPSLEAAVGKVCSVWRSSLLPSAAAAAAAERLPPVDSSVSGNPKPGGCLCLAGESRPIMTF